MLRFPYGVDMLTLASGKPRPELIEQTLRGGGGGFDTVQRFAHMHDKPVD